MMPTQVLDGLKLLFAALASGLFIHSLRHRSFKSDVRAKSAPFVGKVALLCFGVATVIATWQLFGGAQAGSINGFGAPFLAVTLGWLTIAAGLVFRALPIGVLTAPVTTLILLIQYFSTVPAKIYNNSGAELLLGDHATILVRIHIVSAMIGEAFGIGACGVGMFYLWQRRSLKNRLVDQLAGNLPALDILEKLLAWCLWIGFIFFTVSLVTGALYFQSMWSVGHPIEAQTEGQLSAKIIWAIAVWIWYLATLVSRNLRHSGKRIALLSVGGFVLLAVSYFGMIFFRSPLGGS